MNSPLLLTLETIADINFNIIVRIYKHLDFTDQLRFAQTSQWLKQIFRDNIWKSSYKTLKVDCVKPGYRMYIESDLIAPSFINVYEMNGTRICLNPTEFNEFVALYANEVTELDACDNYFPDIRNFKNITSIKSNTGENVEEHFKIVQENCPKLHTFEVKRSDTDSMINFLNFDYLFKLRHLKILSLECEEYTMEYKQFCNIITNLNLECLRIASVNVNVPKVRHVKTPKFLTELHINISDSRLLAWNFNVFENLLRLSLSCEKTINANDWNTFCTAAKRLEAITMTFLEMPKTMEILNLPTSLKQINIENCKNLTGQHLTQIFNLPNLLNFSSTESSYKMRNSFNCKLPTQLQSLNCDRFNTFDLLTSLENNQNLEELTWHNYKKKPLLNHDNRLLFCKSLKTLNIANGPLASDIIMRMQNLCKLSLCHEAVFLWSDIIHLIKHPDLKELYISTYSSDELLVESSVCKLVEGFPINLRVLSIESSGFEINLNFWLDLLCKNLSRLKLIVNPVNRDFLKEIVGHKNFPKRRLSTITYDNYILDCKTLQIKYHDKNKAGLFKMLHHMGPLVLGNDKIE